MLLAMFRDARVCLFAVGFVSLAAIAQAADPPGKLMLKTERVIAFKDGYCLVIKRGEAAANEEGQLYLDDVPDAAVLGSFWATPTQGRLVNMVAGWKEATEETEQDFLCKETIELLLANQGRPAKVEMHDKTLLSGTIHEVLVERAQAPFPVGAVANFILRTDDGDVMLPAAQVRSLTVKEMNTRLPRTVTTSRRTKRLTFQFDEARQKQELRLIYFRPGVRWIPTYRVDLGDKNAKKTAQIELQAEILNEAEDLADVPLDIVVGVPNFRFRQTPSPLVLESVLRNALLDSDPNLMGNGINTLSNAMYSQRSSEFRRDAAMANAQAQQGTIDLPNELKAAGTQDQVVYHLPKLTLGKGERAAVPIFKAVAPYRDIYTWDVHVQRPDIDAAPSGAGLQSPLTLAKNEVWHQIELTNSTNVPWTTGAALIMQGQQPLSQELLTYTPQKNEVRVPVTVSVDTRGSFSEKEVGRELNSLSWAGYAYARIDKLATLHLCNNKPVAIETEITLRLGGKADQASHEGAVTLGAFDAADWVQYQGHPAVNNSSRIVWRVKLQPGETFEPTVKYHYFTRN
ncbi:MAG: hypothetical protein WD872_14870 [Pirellulaceae bacterium]